MGDKLKAKVTGGRSATGATTGLSPAEPVRARDHAGEAVQGAIVGAVDGASVEAEGGRVPAKASDGGHTSVFRPMR